MVLTRANCNPSREEGIQGREKSLVYVKGHLQMGLRKEDAIKKKKEDWEKSKRAGNRRNSCNVKKGG